MRCSEIVIGAAFVLCSMSAFAREDGKTPSRENVHSGNGGAALSFGINTIDEARVFCPNDRPCKLVTNATVEANTNGTRWSICVLVDGKPTIPVCTDQPQSAGAPTTGSIISIAKLYKAAGFHKVKLQVVLPSSGTLGGWGATYAGYQ